MKVILLELLISGFWIYSNVLISGDLCFDKLKFIRCVFFNIILFSKVCNFYKYIVIKILSFCLFNNII